MKKIGIMGGSFDPPHMGHVLAVTYTAMTGGFDEVLVIPTYVHPVKSAEPRSMISFYHRAKMCQMAFGYIPKVIVDTIEGSLPTPSFTTQTLRALRERLNADYRFIIGSDILQHTDQWEDFDEVLRLAPPFVIGRLGYPGPDDNIVMPGISSSGVRSLLKEARFGKTLSKVVPENILEYINEYGLYDTCDECYGDGKFQQIDEDENDDKEEESMSKKEESMTTPDLGSAFDDAPLGMGDFSDDASVVTADDEPEEKDAPSAINGFMGSYEFLSIMCPAPQKSSISYEDENGVIQQIMEEFPSVAHAFQASKTLDRDVQVLIRDAATARDAQKLGGSAPLVDGWDNKKLDIMERLLEDKFAQHIALKLKLLCTGKAELVEALWRNPFWGITNNHGAENNLGKLLMKVRSRIFKDEGDLMTILRAHLGRDGIGFVADWIDQGKVSIEDADPS